MSEIEKIHVLIVDDSATIRKIITKHLGEKYVTLCAANGEEAWQILQSNSVISLVFLDLHMPVMNGMMLLKQIRPSDSKHLLDLPVIMITGHEDSEAAKRASHTMGATDFISKPFSSLDIISRAKAHAKFSRKIASLEQKLTPGSLTNLYNKRGLQELGEKAILSSKQDQSELSILLMQIKDDDSITAEFGEEIFQQIILSTTGNVKKSLRDDDALAHLGSGQFAVLLSMTNAFKAHIIAMRIQSAINKLVFKIGDKTIKIVMAVGLNSTESYSDDLTFTEWCIQTEKALQASLQHKDCKIIRRAELFPEVPYYDMCSKPSFASKFHEKSTRDLSSSLQNNDIEKLCSYMPAIMNGDYETIPLHHVKCMIKPMQSYLDYAYNHPQIKRQGKITKVT